VRVAVSAKLVLGASARIYLLPVAGLLAGAGLAQLAATALISPSAGGNAAGIGGIAGAVLAVLLGRRLANRPGARTLALPRIVAIIVDSGPDGTACVDASGSPRVE
jgi:positive regulator of sigma E activity